MAKKPTKEPTTVRACSIQRFCDEHGISMRTYYAMKAEGYGPAEMRVGTRVLISEEAAAKWRREREAATAAEKATG